MTFPTDITTKSSSASRSACEPELLEAFWGPGEQGRALYREAQEIIARKYPSSTKPAKVPRARRQSSPDGLRTPDEAARKLSCSIKTLNAHVAAGDLRYVSIGKGKKRTRRMFADPDLEAFIKNQTRKESPCLSDATRGRRSTHSTSRSTVVAFSALRRRPPDGKPKP